MKFCKSHLRHFSRKKTIFQDKWRRRLCIVVVDPEQGSSLSQNTFTYANKGRFSYNFFTARVGPITLYKWVIWVITITTTFDHLFSITFCQFGSFNVTKYAPVRFTLLIDPRNETKNGRSYNVTTWFRLSYSLVGKECADQEEQYFPLTFTFYSPGNE